MSLLKTVINWFKPVSKISLEPTLQSILNISYKNRTELYDALSKYTLEKYHDKLEELNDIFNTGYLCSIIFTNEKKFPCTVFVLTIHFPIFPLGSPPIRKNKSLTDHSPALICSGICCVWR